MSIPPATLQYDELPQWEQELIDDTRRIIGDFDPDGESRFLEEDDWALVLKSVTNDWNRCRPRTSYLTLDLPESIGGLFELGLFYYGAMAIANQFLGDLPVQGYAGPYVDTSLLYDRWNRRAMDLAPEWRKARNRSKLEFLPRGAGTVDRYNLYGRSASVVPMLRASPSWGYMR